MVQTTAIQSNMETVPNYTGVGDRLSCIALEGGLKSLFIYYKLILMWLRVLITILVFIS